MILVPYNVLDINFPPINIFSTLLYRKMKMEDLLRNILSIIQTYGQNILKQEAGAGFWGSLLIYLLTKIYFSPGLW